LASQLADVAAGYVDLASTLAKEWSGHVSKVADKLEAGGYRANDAVADLASTTLVVGKTWFLIASEALDAIAILADSKDEPAESSHFVCPVPRATLVLTGPLTDGFGNFLPAGAVTVIPSTLAPGETRFFLRADATGYPGSTYEGEIAASGPDDPPQAIIPVWIAVQ
jgi:hypothetical protein